VGARHDLGRPLLATFRNLEGLVKANLQELQQVPGIGPVLQSFGFVMIWTRQYFATACCCAWPHTIGTGSQWRAPTI
jgi:hypothetical protein